MPKRNSAREQEQHHAGDEHRAERELRLARRRAPLGDERETRVAEDLRRSREVALQSVTARGWQRRADEMKAPRRLERMLARRRTELREIEREDDGLRRERRH